MPQADSCGSSQFQPPAIAVRCDFFLQSKKNITRQPSGKEE
jgi:hypothetical protein